MTSPSHGALGNLTTPCSRSGNTLSGDRGFR